MRKLDDLSAFLSVAEHLSFQRAATERGVSRSALSHAIRNLEDRLGARLLNRDNRNVSLTEPGRLLQSRLKPAFAEIFEAVDEVNSFRDRPRGTLRLTVPRAIGTTLIGPVAAAVTRANPGLSIDISSDDRLVDIVAEGYDAGIRFGERLQQNMIAVKINFPLHFAVVGAPEYFEDRKTPEHPSDLHHHCCIRYRFPTGTAFPWEFRRGDEAMQVTVDGPIQTDDQEVMIEAALAGGGLAFVFAERVATHLESGKLIRCLQNWSPQFSQLYLYYPDRAYVSAGLRAFIDHLRKLRPA